MEEPREQGYRYFLRCRSARAIPCIHHIRLRETAKPTKMIRYLRKVVCQHFLNWFVGETFKNLNTFFWNLVYRRYTRCIGEFATVIQWVSVVLRPPRRTVHSTQHALRLDDRQYSVESVGMERLIDTRLQQQRGSTLREQGKTVLWRCRPGVRRMKLTV